MTLVLAAGHVRLHGDAQAAKDTRHDGQPRQAIGIKVPEDHDPFAPGACPSNPLRERLGVRQEGRVVQPRSWRAEEPVQVGRGGDTAPDEHGGDPLRDPVPAGGLEEFRAEGQERQQVPAVARLEGHGLRMPRMASRQPNRGVAMHRHGA